MSKVVISEAPIKKGKVNFSLLASQFYFYYYVSYSYYLMLIFIIASFIVFAPNAFLHLSYLYRKQVLCQQKISL